MPTARKDARVLGLGGCEEMLSEVAFRRYWLLAEAGVPCDGDSCGHERKKAERRNGKENEHACLLKDNKVHGLRAAYSIRSGDLGQG
jgi:hypothetical protein